MDEPQIDAGMFKHLIEYRDILLMEFAEQHPPPERLAAPLWQAHKLISEGVEEVKGLPVLSSRVDRRAP